MPHPTPHPLKKLLKAKPQSGKKSTTAMTYHEWLELHELRYYNAVYDCGRTDAGLVIVALGSRKGSKAKIKEWLMCGVVRGR